MLKIFFYLTLAAAIVISARNLQLQQYIQDTPLSPLLEKPSTTDDPSKTASQLPQKDLTTDTPSSLVSLSKIPKREIEEQGYMRIIGNLRWDKLRSITDWRRKFPGCFDESKSDDSTYIEASGIPQKCTYEVGGIRFKLESVSFWDYDLAETFGGNGFMRLTSLVKYSVEDSQSGVFEQLYKVKYSTDQQGRTCSKYTCISFEDWWRTMKPTWHTQSIMLNGRDQAGPTNSRFNNSEF